jgi:Xaa-Pro aminopeptidase
VTDYLAERRRRVAQAWQLSDEIVLIGAGDPILKPGRGDQVYSFLPHPEYYYLTDRCRPGSVLAFDPRGGWHEFEPEVSEAEIVWEGRDPRTQGRPVAELAGWLANRTGRPVASLGCAVADVNSDTDLAAGLHETLTYTRRPKDAIELARIRKAAAATAAGFERLPEIIEPGRTERQVQIDLEAEFFRAGAEAPAYDTIVGTGTNAAVLHFSPSHREIQKHDLVLIDAGAQVEGYAADVTRTFPANGQRSGFGAELYDVVLAAQKRAVDRCLPGVEFRDVHLAAARDLAAGLVELQILRGRPEDLVEQDVVALFFPHGIGHMVGLGVRDASGYLAGRKRSTRPGLSALRCDFPLEPGYVMTIEPGLYFIPALLNDAGRRARYADAVSWARVDQHMGLGGIRIEDNLLITSDAPENLTSAIPK